MLAIVSALALAASLIPVHGVVTDVRTKAIVVRVEAVPKMISSQTQVDGVANPARFRKDEQIDAYLNQGARVLIDAKQAPPFVAGMPTIPIDHVLGSGDRLPSYTLIDQHDHLTRLDTFPTKVVLLSFVFSRCPDLTLCPAISAKFAYLQHILDPARFHLVEVTLDPRYDSPAILAGYGKRFGADPARWSILSGEPAEVKDVGDLFGISSIQDSTSDFLHNDRLVIADGTGTIRMVIPTAGWNPDDVAAAARNVAGLSSSPFRRFMLAAIEGVASLCGGSTTTGIVLLDLGAFFLGVAVLGALLVWFGWQIWGVKE